MPPALKAISAGKLWAMRRLSDADGFFMMTAVDQRPGVVAHVAKDNGEARYEDVGAVKRLLIEELSPVSSAILVDPGFDD